jgi:hypothetical protein
MRISGRKPLAVCSGPVAVLAAIALALFVRVSNASIIISWDETRGGASSLADDPGYASTRAMIASSFSGMTIVDAPTITTANLAGANVAWIGSDFGNTSAITPLIASEQAALVSFVQGGGTLLLFGENDLYDLNASIANNSLFAPFGAHNTGTLAHTQAYSFPSPGSFPLTGPFGSVSSLSSNYPGWFDTLPAGSSVVADLSGNGEPVIATLPAGALGLGSGAVWFFGDSGGATDGGVQGGDWNTLYANILSQAGSPIQVPEPGSSMVFVLIGSSLLVHRTRRVQRQA